jgi:hypothetical protein
MTDVAGNPEEERHVDFYYQPWVTEGVCRYDLEQESVFRILDCNTGYRTALNLLILLSSAI